MSMSVSAIQSQLDFGSLLPLWLGGVTLVAGLGVGLLFLMQRARLAVADSAPSAAADTPPRLSARRLQGGQHQPAALRPPMDTAALWTVDRALRALATACHDSGRALPHLYAVTLDPDRIVLRLASPDDEAPAPWAVGDNGRSWEASLRSMQDAPVNAEVSLPPLRLVTLGIADGSRVLLDLGQATGVIRLDGAAPDLRALGLAWAAELAVSPWSDGVRVILSGLRDGPRPPGAEGRVKQVSNVRDALTEIAVAEGTAEAPGTEMLRGSRQDSGRAAPGVLVLTSPPSGREAQQVQALASRPDAGWAVVVLGSGLLSRGTEARWRFTLDPDGRLDTGVLGITVYAVSGSGWAER
jgi:hypothetical protein